MLTVEAIDFELEQGLVLASSKTKRLLYYPLTGKYEVQVDGHTSMVGSDEHKASIVDKYNSIQG